MTDDEEDDFSLDEEFPLGDGVADVDTLVVCPHCAEEVEIAVDPGGGTDQSYIEDCPVCCSPWLVRLRYAGGSVEVTLEQTDG